MYIQPYYLGLFVGAFGTVAAEIAIVLISNYRDKNSSRWDFQGHSLMKPIEKEDRTLHKKVLSPILPYFSIQKDLKNGD